MSYKGKYQPSYPRKYKGNPTNIVYRSLWKESSWFIVIIMNEYLSGVVKKCMCGIVHLIDNRHFHRYFPDFYIKVKESTGAIKKYIIEIKPNKQTKPPAKPKRQTKGLLT